MRFLGVIGVLPPISRLATVGLLGLLMLVLSNCTMSGNSLASEQRLPQFLQLIELPNAGDGSVTERLAVVPGGYAYVFTGKRSVAALNGPELVEEIHVPDAELHLYGDITANPQSGLVYVADSFNRQIHIIQGTDVVTTLATLNFVPHHLAVVPNTGLVYVGGSSLADDTDALPHGILVLQNTQVITYISTYNGPEALAVNKTTNRLYAGLSLPSREYAKADSLAAVIEGTALIKAATLGYDTREMGVIPDLAVNQQTDEVYLLQNLGTIIYWHGDRLERVKLSQMGYYPLNFVEVDSTRNFAYVGVQDGPPSNLVVIQKNQVVTTLKVGFDPQYAVYDETHDYLYVTNYRSGTLSVIRGTEIVATLETHGEGAWYIGVDEERGYIYVSNADSHNVAVFGFAKSEQPSLWQRFLPFIQR